MSGKNINFTDKNIKESIFYKNKAIDKKREYGKNRYHNMS